MSRDIEDYALIGDGQTAALVARQGSIDWLCWPQFDSDACFAGILGDDGNGCWSIRAKEAVSSSTRRYEDDTLIVEMVFETGSGKYLLRDFMPLRTDHTSSVIRMVEGLEGSVELDLRLTLRFDYGTLPPWQMKHDRGFTAKLGPDNIVLDSPVPVEIVDDDVVASFTVKAGERLDFVLQYGPSHFPDPDPIDPRAALERSRARTREWIGRFDSSRTDWPEIVKRSLLTLKAMIHQPTGGVVAAPTTSLPETAGGTMNWDYRYCWLRDATFTLGALLDCSFTDEAVRWRDWLLRAIAGSPERMRIMYRIDGSRHLSEWEVDALAGWRHAVPVRIGNAASTQHQIDVYGEVLDCLHLARLGGIETTPQERIAAVRLVKHLAKVWVTPGSGVWESRETPRHYTYSKVMAWVGVDRVWQMLKNDADDGLIADRDELIGTLGALRDTIRNDVLTHGWNEGLQTFTQYYGGHELDASILLMPLVGFLPPDDHRVVSTVEAVQRELSEGGLIRRQKLKADGPNEGAFLACSCWMADCLNMMGRKEEARAQFERVLALMNDVHLLAEEYDVPGKRQTGNFPQALTHLAVVNTAMGLCGPTLHRGGG